MTHAPYAIIGDLVITYGKTTKTACGKRRTVTTLVARGTQTCPDCTTAINADHDEARKMLEALIGLTVDVFTDGYSYTGVIVGTTYPNVVHVEGRDMDGGESYTHHEFIGHVKVRRDA